MVRMSSNEVHAELGAERETLLALARQSIEHGVHHGVAPTIDLSRYATLLQQPGACFVTLLLNDELRGCIGSLVAHRPLAKDVIDNAFAAAFQDPRFSPLTPREFSRIHIHLSILTPAQPLTFGSEEDLLRQIRPGVDGLILEDKEHRGTFLPSVWEQLPTTTEFWRHLKRKAGLPEHYWSSTLRVQRYETLMLREEE
jgi:hypothetical protein